MAGWFVAYTVRVRDGETEDSWEPHPTKESAEAAYYRACHSENLNYACMGQIVEATEPHWKEGGF